MASAKTTPGKKIKPPKPFGCGACPWVETKAFDFVPPVEPVDPNIILLFGTPSATGCKLPLEARPVVLFAANCESDEEPGREVINACRDAYVWSLLMKHPGLPVVAFGKHAWRSLFGGNPGDTSYLGDVLMVEGHRVYCTYEPSKLREVNEHIEVMLTSALAQPLSVPHQVNPWLFDEGRLRYLGSKFLYLDIECESLVHPSYGNEIYLVGIQSDHAEHVDIYTWPEFKTTMAWLFTEYGGIITGSNIGFDMIRMAWHGVKFPKAKLYDTILFEKCKTKPPRWAGLKWQAKNRFGVYGYEAEVDTYLRKHKTLKGYPIPDLYPYLALDVFLTKEVRQAQAEEKTNLIPFELECDYLRYMVDMQNNGLHVDRPALAQLVKDSKPAYTGSLNTVRALTTLDFNPGSPAQVMTELKCRKIKAKNSQEGTLHEFKGDPFVDALQAYRVAAKFRGTYLKGYYNTLTGPKKDKIYSTFSVHGAVSGRLSSSKPNVENSDPKIRPVFTSRFPGGKLIRPDLSALEYRLIAHVSKDPKLLKVFQTGEDIHIKAYQEMFGVTEVDKDQRYIAKQINYAAVYGCGPDTFFEMLGSEDLGLYNRAQVLYPGVNRYKAWVVEKLYRTGMVESQFGRQWHFPVVNQASEREGFNYIFQSMGHDILMVFLMAVMDNVTDVLGDCVKLCNEVHDDFLIDTPNAWVPTVANIIEGYGKDLNPLITQSFGIKMLVPFLAEVKILDRWEK